MEKQEFDKCCDCNPVNKRLWIIVFNIISYNGDSKGCAVVKADNPEQARRVLLSEGLYNGTPKKYEIIRIEEIIPSPDTMLICEQINE